MLTVGPQTAGRSDGGHRSAGSDGRQTPCDGRLTRFFATLVRSIGMASVSSEPVGTSAATESERVAALESELACERRRRVAAEEWAEFLERELEARDRRLESVIDHYEAQLEGLKEKASPEPKGPWTRLTDRVTGWLRRR